MLETVFHTTVMDFLPQSAEPLEARELPERRFRLHLLVVDSDAAVRSACAEIATSLGFAVQSTCELAQARTLLQGQWCRRPAGESCRAAASRGLSLFPRVKASFYPGIAVIAMTASGSVNAAVEAMRCGAADYLTKPFAVDELSTVLGRCRDQRR